ncbi:mannitol operon repressor [Escherichia coli]|uniref:Mannitol operon repressor n=1 Tax=Escherichia coli TaxID=562 RepID=A0A376TYQ2_ECOLX|nr:mannitol operon repressor [Escherichia coli]
MVDQAQDTLRPNNRLSDMQATMEQTQAFENRVLERLNAGKTVRSFLITAVELLTEAVNLLVLQVFRKDDYAVKYAVETVTRRRRSAGRSFCAFKTHLRVGRH